MNMPGTAGEASVYQTNDFYRFSGGRVYPDNSNATVSTQDYNERLRLPSNKLRRGRTTTPYSLLPNPATPSAAANVSNGQTEPGNFVPAIASNAASIACKIAEC